VSGNLTTAVLMATAAADDGGSAAALPWEGGIVLDRALAQVGGFGLADVRVITRPEFEAALRESAERAGATLHVCDNPGEDLAEIAEIASSADGGLVLAVADLIVHRSALEGLLVNPSIVTGVLATGIGSGGVFGFRGRNQRGRLVSAASAYHSLAGAKMTCLGVLKVSGAENDALVETARELAEIMSGPLPGGWEREFESKQEQWRLALGRLALKAERWAAREALDAAGRSSEELPPLEPEEYTRRRRELALSLPPQQDLDFRLRTAAIREDVVSLILVGLIRRSVHMGAIYVRGFFWSRALSRSAIDRAALAYEEADEEKVLLKSAVKGSDGFFTTFFVSTWSRYLARWAARIGLTPNQVTVVSLCVGIAAAAAFATGERTGYVIGAVVLYLAFVLDCVDGQLARYTRSFSKFGAYLDSIFDRSKEYIAFAGLGIGAGSAEVWVLAAAALTLQVMRHSFDFSFGATDRQSIAETEQPPVTQAPDAGLAHTRMKARGTLEPRLGALEERPPSEAELREAAEDADDDGDEEERTLLQRILGGWRLLNRIPGLIWVKKMAAFPIGERFAVICVTVAFFDPRTSFIVLLSWGGFALLYTSAGRALRTLIRLRAAR